MGSEFDNEIDVILRKSRNIVLTGERASANGGHPDAEQFAAFAEDSLPSAARVRFVSHIADCGRCRSVLSNLMMFSESESAPIIAATVTESVPWYRRLFVFPQIAYSMGALVVVFAAFFGYIAYRSLEPATEVSKATQPIAANSDVSQRPANVAVANSNAAAPANSAAPTNSAITANTVPTASNRRSDNASADDSGPREPDVAEVRDSPPSSNAASKPEPMVAPAGGETATESASKATPNLSLGNVATADESKKESRPADEEIRTRSAPKAPSKKLETKDEIRKIGSRTFKRSGGVWIDSNYGSQPLTTVRRGSDDYNRLEPEVRSIAENLSGPVIVVSGSRAVRIN